MGGVAIFTGKVALITGAGRGIGLATAKKLLNLGAKVIIADISNAENIASEINKDDMCLGVTLDVTNVKNIKTVFSEVLSRFGKVDILINNAGICPTTSIEEIDEDEWDHVMAVNLKGAYYCVQAVADVMKKQKYGRIVNISSTAGRGGSAVVGVHYSASKAGILGLTKALAKILGPFNITVNAIAPGTTLTEMTKTFSEESISNILNSIPLNKLGKPEYIADLLVFLVSDNAQWITGATIDINGGMFIG